MLDFVLRLAGAKGLRQVAPEAIEPRVGHLEEAAHIARAARSRNRAVSRGVAVARVGAVAVALEKAQRHERVEEVGNRAAVQAQRPSANSAPVMALAPAW